MPPNDQAEEQQLIDPEVEVDSAEYTERRRLRSINDTRELANRAGARAWGMYLDGEISRGDRQAMTFVAVRGFLRDIKRPLSQVDKSEELLNEEELHTWRLQPPTGKAADPSKHRDRRPSEAEPVNIGTEQKYSVKKEQNAIVPKGLNFVMKSAPKIPVTWGYTLKNRYRADEQKTVTVERPIPEEVAVSAYDLAIEALDETGLNLNIHGGEQDVDPDPF